MFNITDFFGRNPSFNILRQDHYIYKLALLLSSSENSILVNLIERVIPNRWNRIFTYR